MSTLVYTFHLGRPSLLLVLRLLPARAEADTYVKTPSPARYRTPWPRAGLNWRMSAATAVALPSRGQT
jgi:hypothetical protein